MLHKARSGPLRAASLSYANLNIRSPKWHPRFFQYSSRIPNTSLISDSTRTSLPASPCSWLETSGTRLVWSSGCPFLAAPVPLSA